MGVIDKVQQQVVEGRVEMVQIISEERIHERIVEQSGALFVLELVDFAEMGNTNSQSGISERHGGTTSSELMCQCHSF